MKVSSETFTIFSSSQYYPQRYSLLIIWWISLWKIFFSLAFLYSEDFFLSIESSIFSNSIISQESTNVKFPYFLY